MEVESVGSTYSSSAQPSSTGAESAQTPPSEVPVEAAPVPETNVDILA